MRAGALAGAVAGGVLGLFGGAVLGGLLTYLSGAILIWQTHLAFSLGVTADLLPLGDRAELLALLAQRWWLVIPAGSLLGGVPGGVAGGLGGALLVAVFNSIGAGVDLVVVEVQGRPLVAAPEPDPVAQYGSSSSSISK